MSGYDFEAQLPNTVAEAIEKDFYAKREQHMTGVGQIHYNGDVLFYFTQVSIVTWEGSITDPSTLDDEDPCSKSFKLTSQDISTAFFNERPTDEQMRELILNKNDENWCLIRDEVDSAKWEPVIMFFNKVFTNGEGGRVLNSSALMPIFSNDQTAVNGQADFIIRVHDHELVSNVPDEKVMVMGFLDSVLAEGSPLYTRMTIIAHNGEETGVSQFHVAGIDQVVIPILGTDNFDLVVVEPDREGHVRTEFETANGMVSFVNGTPYLSQYRLDKVLRSATRGQLAITYAFTGSQTELHFAKYDGYRFPAVQSLEFKYLGQDSEATPSLLVANQSDSPHVQRGEDSVKSHYEVVGYAASSWRSPIKMYC